MATKEEYIILARQKGITLVTNESDFIAKLGIPGFLEDHSYYTPGTSSKAATRRRIKQLQDEQNKIMKARDSARAAFRAMITSGEIRLMTRLEKLQATAKGHADNPSVQAARRLLAKHYNIK